jgi:AraC-like DNA-binding protein
MSAAERLKDGYGATRAKVTKGPEPFSLVANNLCLTDVGLSYVATTGHVSASFPTSPNVRQIFNLDGTAFLFFGGVQQTIERGLWSSVIPAEMAGTIDFGPGYAQVALRINRSALNRCMAALIGREIDHAIEFEPPGQNPSMHALKTRVVQFATDYNARGIYFSSLANTEVERMLIMKFLMCHRHSYSHLLLREPIPASSSTVRRVEEYLEANWHKPIDIEILTQVTGVSARSLFRQFKKERGQTPWEFVKAIRMRKALVTLENPGRSTSVTQVALQCGFHNIGHFAQAYKSMFGELPSETLRRSPRK